MRRFLSICLLGLSACSLPLVAQHTLPLPLDKTRSMEVLAQHRQVLKTEAVELEGWRHEGLGQLVSGGQLQGQQVVGKHLTLLVPIETGKRAVGAAGDSDYAIYGTANISKNMNGRDLRGFNRIVMDILPICKGTGIMNLNLYINNHPSGDLGAHLINLTNNKWNHIVFDMSGVRRDHVQSLRLYTDVKGRNLFEGDSLTYIIRDIQLQQTDQEVKESGWNVAGNQIAYSMSGYLPKSSKTAILGFEAKQFEVVDAQTGKVVFQGKVKQMTTTIGSYLVADFSSLEREGTYILKAGQHQTHPFRISKDAFVDSQWKVLNYIFCQRCGSAVPGIHGVCHQDLMSVHDGKARTYMGGWHDAGDLSQQTLQSGDVAFALAEAYRTQKTTQPQLANRMKEESLFGYRFILRNRLGDGWHASSMGLLHWTDGIVGTADDITTVRTQNNSFDNFLYAGYEAYAALAFHDDAMADSLRQAAIEDFEFARQKFEKKGFDVFEHMMEHTYNTSHSLYMAVMSWSASQLYLLTHQQEYADKAAEYIKYVLDCQETEGKRAELKGYFYRDKSRIAIVHFIHQSRDQMFAMALSALCQSQPRHPDYAKWKNAVSLYGNYLKSLAKYTAPYGMVASGTYMTEEYKDVDGFYRLNLWAPKTAPELYEQQLRAGVKLDEHHYLRRFPTWFSIFNGNEAILLSTGKAAAVCGKLLGDRQLLDMGRGQLYWTVGANPFCQSLIYGEGYNYPSMDSFSSGEIMGEMPVGIRALGNEDVPYWPQTNNACYKEVWVTSAGKWLSLLAEY